MTLPATSKAFSEALPPQEAQKVANQLRRLLASAGQGDVELYAHPTGEEKTKIELHPLVSDALMEVLRYIGSGDAVTLIPINKMLTTQQAADILNVSRPYLIKLLENGELQFELVGRHRRIKAQDLFDYKELKASSRAKALQSLAKSDGELL